MINDFKSKVNKIIESKKILGLAVEEDCLLAAEMHYDGNGFQLNKTKSLSFPEGVSFEKPDEMGRLFRQFLSDNGFTSKKTVIGIPGKWFMMREKTVPPSTKDTVSGILKIQAGREFSIGADALVIDYTGHVNEKESSRLFLGAVRHKNFENILETSRAAGLNILSITPVSMSLREIVLGERKRSSSDYFLYLRPDFAEVLTGENGQVTSIRHIPMDRTSGINQLVPEVKRIISFHPDSGIESKRMTLLIWNASDIDHQELSGLKDSISANVDILENNSEAITSVIGDLKEKNHCELLVPATLIPAYIKRGEHYFDFYNSRMDVKRSKVEKRHVVWASAIILAIVIFLLNIFFTWKSDKNDIIAFKSRLEEMSADIESARDIIQKVIVARGWYSERPEVLKCLRELTLAFPPEGSVWATNLALNEDMKGIVSGKAVDEKSVIEVLDSLKDNNMFSNTQMIHIRENGRTSQEVSFSMSFSFKSRGI